MRGMSCPENKTADSFDALVVGAGVWGCTLARRLAEAGKRVLVLEKRAAIGGNVRCETDGVYKYFDMDKSISAALSVAI